MPQSLLNPDVLGRLGELRDQFQQAKPFRHVVIDDFLRPEVAEAMLREFPTVDDPSQLLNEFGVPNPKSQISDVRSLSKAFVDIDEYIQSQEFLHAMQTVTGIPDLRYDPWYYGAGTHENFHGAGLDAHYDFNIHPKTAFHRRLNAIVYLNKDWDPAWKGDIAFHTDPWDLKNDERKSVEPQFNRCVVFETTERSWHSVTPVDLPSDKRDKSRKSFTIYLYTETRPTEETAPEHGTVYVQSNIPEHIKAGHTLTEMDMAEIETNLLRRHDYLRNMYKREYRFSEVIDDLRRQIREWQGTSYIPALGLAKVKHVSAPLYHDGWMSNALRADIELREDTRTLIANVWLPDDEEPIDLEVRFDSSSARSRVVGGVNSIRLPISGSAGQQYALEITATPTRPASASDERRISVIVDSLVFER